MMAGALALLTLSLLAAGMSGCASTPTKTEPTSPRQGPVVMTGTGGDLNRYVGTWISVCGKEFTLKPDGTGNFTSAVTSFRFTSISDKTAQGTLTIETFASRDCTGAPKRAVEDIVITYVDHLPVIGPLGTTAGEYSGFADRVVAAIAGRNEPGNELNIGFSDNFSRFQISPLRYFASNQLVYAKK